MTPQLFLFAFLGCSLATVRGQEDEWIDPFDMTHYDSASKTTTKISPELPKKVDTERIPSGDVDQKENYFPEIAKCFQKLVDFQKALEDIKHKASILKQQPGFLSVLNSNVYHQLLKSIEQLSMPHKDDFCHVPWLCLRLEEARRFISAGLLIVATLFTNLSDVLSQPNVTHLLARVGCPVIVLFLFVYKAVEWLQRQHGQRDRPEQNRDNGLRNDDREQEHQEGERGNLNPEDQGQELVPPVVDMGPEQAGERTAAEPPGQGSDASEDECYDENNSITKRAIRETEPDMQHCAE